MLFAFIELNTFEVIISPYMFQEYKLIVLIFLRHRYYGRHVGSVHGCDLQSTKLQRNLEALYEVLKSDFQGNALTHCL